MNTSLSGQTARVDQEKHHRAVGNEHLRTWSRQPASANSRGLPSRVRITRIDPT
ncbi:hypothetical protein [Lysobacter sp. A03]|uniref:hypothetical protein n=1 Tax=Lysobacter sp. A03 TaxID=1199154 RepID=UPI001364DBED|nr:hypothetical protein [Lysobacter sp. A03]